MKTEFPQLREVRMARPDAGQRRRWFASAQADLYVWQDSGGIHSFEFCYNKPNDEHMLTWHRDGELRHLRVDDGEHNTLRKMSPIVIPDGTHNRQQILHCFEEAARDIDREVYEFVAKVLRDEEIK